VITGSENLPPSCTWKHPKTKKGELKLPPPLPLCWQWPGIKLLRQTTPTSTKMSKKGSRISPFYLILSINSLRACVRSFFPWLRTDSTCSVWRVVIGYWLRTDSTCSAWRVVIGYSVRPSVMELGFQADRAGRWFSGLGISTLGPGFSHSRFPRPKPENF
jgi:hypothetical protein